MERTCDCCPNPAVVHEIVVRDGVKAEVHLCVEHAQERGFLVPTSHGPALILGKLLEQAKQPPPPAPKACACCGTTMSQVRESGLVGCPLCYRSFEKELSPIIERAQAGSCAHVGRHPAQAAELVDRAALRNRLARELREAVAQEQYERAARLRDRLGELGAAVTLAPNGADTSTDPSGDLDRGGAPS